MSDRLEDQLDLALDTHRQRRRQREAEQAQSEKVIRDAHTELEHMHTKFHAEVRSLIEKVVGRANRHLAKRAEKCYLSDISGYFTGPLYVGGSACNPIAYALRIDGREVGETLIVELTHEGMIEAFLGPFCATASDGNTTRLGFGWHPVPLDRFDANIASDLVLRYITAITSRWPLRGTEEPGWH